MAVRARRLPLRPHEARLALILLTLAIAALAVLLTLTLGALLMRRLPLLAVLAATLALTCACATLDFARYAEAANTLDPGCRKRVEIKAVPVLILGWPVPVVSGEYLKDCDPAAVDGAGGGAAVQ